MRMRSELFQMAFLNAYRASSFSRRSAHSACPSGRAFQQSTTKMSVSGATFQKISRRALNLILLQASVSLTLPLHSQALSLLTDAPSISVEEVSPGDQTSPVVVPGARISVQYVLRRSNGYFIDASYGFNRFESYVYTAGTNAVIKGFEQGLYGMHIGARRRFIVPPKLGYVNGTRKNDPGPIPPDWGARRSLDSHRGEPLVFEVLVTKIAPGTT